MKDLFKLFNECKTELDEVGIEYGTISNIKVNGRLTKSWGQCSKVHNSCKWENQIFSIDISKRLLADEVSDWATKQTIIHEILHTCKNCWCHTGEWKRLASIVNSHYDYNIKRCTSSKEKGINEVYKPRHESYKYYIQCTDCGKIFKYKRLCNAVKHPERYICPCGGENLKRVKLENLNSKMKIGNRN